MLVDQPAPAAQEPPASPPPPRDPTWTIDLLLVALIVGAYFLLFLGARPLAVPSEARYAELGREIFSTGDWVTPRINGVKYFFKPPLFYWLQAGFIHLFGLTEFALRLATALLAAGGVVIAYATGRLVHGRTVGWLAATIMATTLLWFALSRVILLDVPVGVFLSFALMAFLFAVKAPEDGAARARWLYAMYVGAAAATMTKGLIGIVLPALVIGLWIVLTWNWRLLLQVKLIPGLILFLVLTAPWHVAVGIKSPEFWHFYFVREHFERFTSTVHGRTQPWWFFAAVMGLGFFPWTVIVLQSLWGNLRSIAMRTKEWRDEIYLALWFWAIFLFFSASDSKLIPYVTPIVVPVAVFAGRYVATAFETGAASLRYALLTVAGLSAALAVAAVVVAIGHDRLFSGDTALDVAIAAPALPWLALGATLTAAALVWATRRALFTGFVVACVASAVFLQGVDTTMAGLQPRSIKPLAIELNKVVGPEDEVIAFRAYPQDLPVYLGRRISVFQWSGELDFGRQWEDTTAWMFDDSGELWRRWQADRTVYMIVPMQFESEVRESVGARFVELARSRRFILIVNRAPS
jgi:4-amino-4-deoxy-L-arabinose transferase-like glycosyltransferase